MKPKPFQTFKLEEITTHTLTDVANDFIQSIPKGEAVPLDEAKRITGVHGNGPWKPFIEFNTILGFDSVARRKIRYVFSDETRESRKHG